MGGGNNQIARICSINRKIKKWFNFEIIKTTSKSYKLNKKITFINKPIESNVVKKYVKRKPRLYIHMY